MAKIKKNKLVHCVCGHGIITIDMYIMYTEVLLYTCSVLLTQYVCTSDTILDTLMISAMNNGLPYTQ